MKSTTFARLALFLPYLILIESAVYYIFFDISETESPLEFFNLAWNFLALFWFLPYTILVTVLLIRSRGKTFEQIKRMFLAAPWMLAGITPVTYMAVLLIGSLISRGFFADFWEVLLFAAAVAIPASLVLGYLFVGFSLLLHRLLIKTRVVRDNDSQTLEIVQPDIAV